MRSRLLIFLGMLLTAQAAIADVNCRAVTSLSRMQANIPLFEAAAISASPIATLGPLYSDMQQMTKPVVLQLFQGRVSRSDLLVLADFVTLTRRVHDLTQAGRNRGIRAIVFSEEFEPTFVRTGVILRGLDCPALNQELSTVSLAVPTQGIGPIGDTRSRTFLEMNMTLKQKGLALLMVCFVAGALTVGIWIRNERLALIRRRNRRFQLCRTITYRNGDETQVARVLDVSGYGAKLEHNGHLGEDDETANTKLTLHLGDETATVRVMWTNSHYAGVKFDTLKSRNWIKWYLEQPDTLAHLFEKEEPEPREGTAPEPEDTPKEAEEIHITPVRM